MEEAEILCDRVSWLRRGNFVVMGNPEKLKIQFSLGYKLHIKFDDAILQQNKNNLTQNTKEAFKNASDLIIGFLNYSNFFLNNPETEPYIQALVEVVNIIKINTEKITLIEIRKDFSFELIITIIQEKKKLLFTDILNMKNTNQLISEMVISMESLENILTSF